jgi:hypothetical protein
MSVLPGTRYRRFYDRAEQVLPKEMINASISSSGDASASKLDAAEEMSHSEGEETNIAIISSTPGSVSTVKEGMS